MQRACSVAQRLYRITSFMLRGRTARLRPPGASAVVVNGVLYINGTGPPTYHLPVANGLLPNEQSGLSRHYRSD